MNPGRRFALFLLLFLTSAEARAASIFEVVGGTAAPVLEMNPSVRWHAMADAGTAAFWDPTHAWANPALLGGAVGVQFETSSEDEEIFGVDTGFDTRRTTLGWNGIGMSTTGWPIPGLGRVQREFAASFEFSDGSSSTAYSLDDVQRVRSWSVGLSAANLLTAYARLRHRDPPAFVRWVDLELGYSQKRVEEVVTSTSSDSTFGNSRNGDWAMAHDRGILLRSGVPIGPVRVDLAYAYSDINSNAPMIGAVFRDHTARDWRNGVAARATWDPAVMRTGPLGWLRAGASPLIAAGWAMDFVHTTAFFPHDLDDRWGVELSLANVVFGRIGRAGDEHPWGIGAGLPLGRFGGARWDHSDRKRGDFGFGPLPDERRDSWTVWIDPLAIFGALRK